MEKLFGVHWTTGFDTFRVELLKTLEEAKAYREECLGYFEEQFVPIEIITSEERLVDIYTKNIYNDVMDVMAFECRCGEDEEPYFNLAVNMYIDAKTPGYEILKKNLDNIRTKLLC